MKSRLFVSILRQSNQLRWSSGSNINRLISTASQDNQELRRQELNQPDRNYDESTLVTCSRLEFIEPTGVPRVPAFRVLNPDGSLECDVDPNLTDEKIVKIYKEMIKLNVFDKIMYESQRQGRISFYMTNFGEEAVAFGSAAALEAKDWIFAQYREAGILLHREMPLNLLVAQCFGNKHDLGKGRAMPIHYGNRSLNFIPISSPLTVQVPQAAGSAYALRMQGQDAVVATYFGEGAASEGDCHAAMNFAATLNCPVLFICRNNGYAISTPVEEQFAGDGIVHRGLGYGMRSIRVDGNDLFAVFAATREARRLCQLESKPCLIEAMTYRVGHHSTSDDSTAYRSIEEVKFWDQTLNPVRRVRNYLQTRNLWSDELEADCSKEARAQVIEALNKEEKTKKPPIETMFDDVYDELPANLCRQRDELRSHLEKYGQHYETGDFERANESN